jgi:hypothetical protein
MSERRTNLRLTLPQTSSTVAGRRDEILRQTEAAKIACGRAHVEALRVKEGSPEYVVAQNLDSILALANP